MKNEGVKIEVVESSVKQTVISLGKLDDKIHKAIARVLHEAGQLVQKKAKEKAPFDFGYLRASIYVDHNGRTTFGKSGIREGNKKLTIPSARSETSKSGLDVIIGSDLEYAGKMEDRDKYMEQGYNLIAPKLKQTIEREINKVTKKH